MTNLTGLRNGVFNTVHLIDDITGDQQEVRDLFLTGSIQQSIPNAPTNNQVLSIPGLIPELNARQLVVNSYTRNEVDQIVQANKGEKGSTGAGSKGSKGDQGSIGEKGNVGSIGPKGSKGATGAGTKGDVGPKGEIGPKGQTGAGSKGDIGQKGEKGSQGATTNTSGFRLISDSYSRSEIDTVNASQSAGINQNAQNQISNQLNISQNIQEIINLQVAISGLQFQDHLMQNQINSIQTTLTSLQNQINAIPAPRIVEASGTQYLPKIITFQGTGLGSVGWFPNTEELVLSFY